MIVRDLQPEWKKLDHVFSGDRLSSRKKEMQEVEKSFEQLVKGVHAILRCA